MTPDPNRKPGFYWVRFEGEVQIMEYSQVKGHWYACASQMFFTDLQVCELLSDRLELKHAFKAHERAKRVKRVKAKRGERRGPWRSLAYRQWISSFSCCICDPFAVSPKERGTSQAAHTENNGMRSKGPDSSCVPLCPSHHRSFDQARASFATYHNVDLREKAKEYFAEWQRRPT